MLLVQFLIFFEKCQFKISQRVHEGKEIILNIKDR